MDRDLPPSKISRCIVEHETDAVMADFRAEHDFRFSTPGVCSSFLRLPLFWSFRSDAVGWVGSACGCSELLQGYRVLISLYVVLFPGIGGPSREDGRQ